MTIDDCSFLIFDFEEMELRKWEVFIYLKSTIGIHQSSIELRFDRRWFWAGGFSFGWFLCAFDEEVGDVDSVIGGACDFPAGGDVYAVNEVSCFEVWLEGLGMDAEHEDCGEIAFECSDALGEFVAGFAEFFDGCAALGEVRPD